MISDQSRPVYIFAHRCNKISHVTDALKSGVNAIECDFVRKDDGAIFARHDLGLLDLWDGETPVVEYLEKAGEIARENPSIAMWCLDIKDSMQTADLLILQGLVDKYLPKDMHKLYTLYGTKGEQKYTPEFLSRLTDREGINYDGNPYDLGLDFGIQRALAWRDEHNIKNFFYSAGIDPLAGAFVNLAEQAWKGIKSALFIKNHGAVVNKYYRLSNDASGMRGLRGDFGVYIWCYNQLNEAAEDLVKYQLDGVMGNTNSLLENALATRFSGLPKAIREGKQFPSIRLATRADTMYQKQTQGMVVPRVGGISHGEAMYLRSAFNGLFIGKALHEHNGNVGGSCWYPVLALEPAPLHVYRADGQSGQAIKNGESVMIETTEQSQENRLGAFSTRALYYEKHSWPKQQTWTIRKVTGTGQPIGGSESIEFGDVFVLQNHQYSDQFLEPYYYTNLHQQYYLTTRSSPDLPGMNRWTFA